MRLIARRVAPVVTLLLFASVGHAGRVTAIFPLPSGAIAALQQDTAGNIYLAGNTGTTTVPSGDSADAVVTKLSSAGTVLFRTTFGGSKADWVTAMAIAPDGTISVIGPTASPDFPLTPDAAQTQFGTNGQTSFFVRLDATGKVIYSSYLTSTYAGASFPPFNPRGITLASTGAAYITGDGSFVSTAGALPMVANAGWVIKLDASGKMVFGTGFIGGSKIAVDSQGFIYLVGSANSQSVLPFTPGAFQTKVAFSICGGDLQLGIGCTHQYVVKLSPTAGNLVYATWVSGTYGANPAAVAVDASGNVTVAGGTASADYPVTPGAYQLTNFSTVVPRDNVVIVGATAIIVPSTGYVTKLNATGTGLIFSTYLGGSSVDAISSMSIDASGRAYLGGIASSTDFPGLSVIPGACRPSYVYPTAFATRLSMDGSSLTDTQLAFGLPAGLVAFDGQGKATVQAWEVRSQASIYSRSRPLWSAPPMPPTWRHWAA
jgi:hypothetical protein